MKRVVIHSVEHSLRLKIRLTGVGEHKEPFRHCGTGGVAEAEALCDEASRDLLAFVRPPDAPVARHLTLTPLRRSRSGSGLIEMRFDSPRPSGHATNDRVVARLIPSRHPRADRKALVFHHALFQRFWGRL